MRHHLLPLLLVTAGLVTSTAACTVTSGDGDGAGGGGASDDEGICQASVESDPGACDGDCEQAVEGEDGAVRCTDDCATAEDCGSGEACVELSDGTGACLEECSGDSGCLDGETCDASLGVCLPGDDTSATCTRAVEADPTACDVACDVAIAGESDDLVACTVSCATSDDCASGELCQELEDGSGACLDDCATDGACADGYACDADLLLCLPGEEAL